MLARRLGGMQQDGTGWWRNPPCFREHRFWVELFLRTRNGGRAGWIERGSELEGEVGSDCRNDKGREDLIERKGVNEGVT